MQAGWLWSRRRGPSRPRPPRPLFPRCATGWLIALVLGASAPAQAPELTVRVALGGRPPLYVGQPLDLEVVTIAGAERPVATPPQLAEATLAPVGLRLRPITSSGIGGVESQTNEYRFRFRLVPHRAGTLLVPPFRVAAGGKAGSSAPQRIEVRPVPATGRPATWLGGVGPLSVSAEARPASVRVGQSFELVVTLSGPGALGSTGPLDRARIEALPLAAEVTPLPDDLTIEPPTRLRRLRIRPTQPGRAVLPPVVVSWFDPASGRYQTAASEAVPVRVVDAPRLDAEAIEYRPTEEPSGAGLLVGAALLVLTALAAWGLARWRQTRRRGADPRSVARRLARRLAWDADRADPESLARSVADALAEYLAAAQDRPRGELTPSEAGTAFEQVSGDPGLGRRAAAVVEGCDRVRYSGRPAEAAAALADEARAILERAAASSP